MRIIFLAHVTQPLRNTSKLKCIGIHKFKNTVHETTLPYSHSQGRLAKLVKWSIFTILNTGLLVLYLHNKMRFFYFYIKHWFNGSDHMFSNEVNWLHLRWTDRHHIDIVNGTVWDNVLFYYLSLVKVHHLFSICVTDHRLMRFSLSHPKHRIFCCLCLRFCLQSLIK